MMAAHPLRSGPSPPPRVAPEAEVGPHLTPALTVPVRPPRGMSAAVSAPAAGRRLCNDAVRPVGRCFIQLRMRGRRWPCSTVPVWQARAASRVRPEAALVIGLDAGRARVAGCPRRRT